jgi:predicted protein tyrosine phosphatase
MLRSLSATARKTAKPEVVTARTSVTATTSAGVATATAAVVTVIVTAAVVHRMRLSQRFLRTMY